jgi:integrase
LGVRVEATPDKLGTPLFTSVGYHGGEVRLSRRTIRTHTDKYLRMAGLNRSGISNHALRHTAATLGYLHTRDLRAVQEFLGHAEPRMTSRYAESGVVHPREGGMKCTRPTFWPMPVANWDW